MIGEYLNGNYKVQIFENGTKIRQNDLDFFDAEFPECIDLKITNHCDLGCIFCHEDSTFYGEHGDILHLPFLESVHPYTEIAIGGGNPLTHPDIEEFLQILKDKNLIANITMHMRHILQDDYRYYTKLLDYQSEGLIHGIGISYSPAFSDNDISEFMSMSRYFRNWVLHMIVGAHNTDDLSRFRDKGVRLLLLGYKEIRRGAKYYEAFGKGIDARKDNLRRDLPDIINDSWFQTICFDNLALDQLHVKEIIPTDLWKQVYMGDDGKNGQLTSASMYIDAVKREFARNSCSERRYPITDNLTQMYQFLKAENN